MSPETTSDEPPRDPATAGAVHPRHIDKVLHDPVRLAMVVALVRTPVLTFPEMKRALGLTDGNLGVHVRRLEEVGYVSVHRQRLRRASRTEYRLAPAGRRALERYLEALTMLVARVRAATIATAEPEGEAR